MRRVAQYTFYDARRIDHILKLVCWMANISNLRAQFDIEDVLSIIVNSVASVARQSTNIGFDELFCVRNDATIVTTRFIVSLSG
ncbi:hypothetical protein A3B32_02290 [Candidatus Uhrbacteria bacterium RIFCSPLOWO2_01_FULL_53_9]|uniref:Uncharacterized protein n=3 Tax=Candidatus Uhriibacteriota TaxID=1752732 RepID=A0A1F7UYF2_9BACT|nr:MAG: hypothetical protein A3C17_01275 [Candidatus Uhrbacteria bacterium RIFCSPHIGHO2_02_FULL_53_13]OGL83301.1 MAG: hypothetical protein A3B32_02290 [Candidatus Uhrbacteria bacterium RIFCSPLOWO2_01_FULL_53_9]OGL88932.1 MAG: hypothetical protein A3I45_01450 [Candidatus Uhrbacteria bacterium RIFCSPLOWO2_02_FULL_53_10]